jgi:hypothetical protein
LWGLKNYFSINCLIDKSKSESIIPELVKNSRSISEIFCLQPNSGHKIGRDLLSFYYRICYRRHS